MTDAALRELGVREMGRELGRSPSLVSRYRAIGMPMSSPADARAWIAANVRPDPRFQRDGAAAGAAHAPAWREAPEERDRGAPDYQKWRARREAAEAAMAELKLGELRGDLVRLAEVRAAHSRRLVMLRESLMQIPNRLAAVLAAESELGACHDLIEDDLTSVLLQVVAVAGQPLEADGGAGGRGRDCDPAAAA